MKAWPFSPLRVRAKKAEGEQKEKITKSDESITEYISVEVELRQWHKRQSCRGRWLINRATKFCVQDNSKLPRLKLRESEVESTENGEFEGQSLAPLRTNEETVTDFGFRICKERRHTRDSLSFLPSPKKYGRTETWVKYSSFISFQQTWST